jgi:hypothetical protein
MKLILEFEAEGLLGSDVVTPLTELVREAATSGLEFGVEGELGGEVCGLTPDGRELRIGWRVER